MSKFNPDEYLAKKQKEFNPDDYLKSKEPVSQGPPGMIESALRGAGQGVTLGFEDELAGAGSAGIDLVQGNVESLQDLISSYTKKRDEERIANKVAEEENPWTYNLSNIAGGIALPAAAIGNVAKGATMGAKAMAGLKAGALGGAAAGLGSSESDTVMGDLKEAATGATIGGVLGPVAAGLGGLGGKVASKVDESLKGYQFPQRITQAFKSGEAGENLFGKEAQQALTVKGQNLAKATVNEFDRIKNYAGSLKDEAIKDLPAYDQRDLYESTTSLLGKYVPDSADEKAILSNLEEIMTTNNGLLTPKQVDDIKRSIGELAYQGNLSVQNEKIAKDIYHTIKKSISSNLPEDRAKLYKTANEAYEDILSTKALGKINRSEGTTQRSQESFNDMINRLMNKNIETFENPQSGSAVNFEKAFKEAGKIEKKLIDAGTEVPNKTLDPNRLTKIKKASDELALKQSTAAGMNQQSPFAGTTASDPSTTLKSTFGTTSGALALRTSSVAGEATGAVKSTLSNTTKWINEATPEFLQVMGKTLTDKGSPYARQVSNIINQPMQKRKALLFTLSQQPGFREEVRQLLGEEEGN